MSMSDSILNTLLDSAVEDGNNTLTGKTLTRPRLVVGGGDGTTYGVNVDIGEGQVLHNVPIANGNQELRYAEAGSPVMLERSRNGRWMVAGFSKQMPGTFHRVAVSIQPFTFGIPEYELGTITNEGLVVRPLTYEELSLYGSYGTIPYGAVGHFRNGELVEIV